jgi:hypothetical protein
MSAPFLVLNQPQVFNGLGTLTYTVVTTGQYYINAQITVPEALPTGSGAGSNKGLGSGSGGGDAVGFNQGGVSADTGGVGHGFGPVANVYPQPPVYGSNQTSGPAVSTGLSVVVNDNGSPIYTMPSMSPTQSAIQFKFPFTSTATHSITVVISSSTASDNALNGVQSVITIGQGT